MTLYDLQGRLLLEAYSDFSYSCTAVDKISTDMVHRIVHMWQLSFLYVVHFLRFVLILSYFGVYLLDGWLQKFIY